MLLCHWGELMSRRGLIRLSLWAEVHLDGGLYLGDSAWSRHFLGFWWGLTYLLRRRLVSLDSRLRSHLQLWLLPDTLNPMNLALNRLLWLLPRKQGLLFWQRLYTLARNPIKPLLRRRELRQQTQLIGNSLSQLLTELNTMFTLWSSVTSSFRASSCRRLLSPCPLWWAR